MKTFKTPKGTDLPITDIKGKDYLNAAYRIVWFREDHALGRIETERISESDKHITYRATISIPGSSTENYIKLANADKTLMITSTLDYEKCETMAIGRALAFSGYGTYFCGDDLDEGDHVADSPKEKSQQTKGYDNPPPFDSSEDPSDPATYVCTVGKYKGRSIGGILQDDGPVPLKSYIKWAEDEAAKKNKPITGAMEEFITAAQTCMEERGL